MWLRLLGSRNEHEECLADLDFRWFLHRKVNRACFLFSVCFSFTFYPGKEISGIVTCICRNVDELARNSNVVILFFLKVMHSMLIEEKKTRTKCKFAI